ncbi:GlsB/YeaQ/YmgE family stress response membrane protein [Pseudorhodobacter sp. W20_MBD10_FR17]|uniref:GlsB/YeaQ/YmgE family stress response membrane protein n=1 Tax=Pseudorhodobacter sp. W20_MBD10_FR17 TaxID=3240266 RepID=UPI003F9776DA
MAAQGLILILIIGGVAGWLAGLIVKGYGFGLLGNIVVGIVGALVAGWIFPMLGLGFGGGILASILHATIGAVVVLFLVRLIKRA